MKKICLLLIFGFFVSYSKSQSCFSGYSSMWVVPLENTINGGNCGGFINAFGVPNLTSGTYKYSVSFVGNSTNIGTKKRINFNNKVRINGNLVAPNTNFTISSSVNDWLPDLSFTQYWSCGDQVLMNVILTKAGLQVCNVTYEFNRYFDPRILNAFLTTTTCGNIPIDLFVSGPGNYKNVSEFVSCTNGWQITGLNSSQGIVNDISDFSVFNPNNNISSTTVTLGNTPLCFVPNHCNNSSIILSSTPSNSTSPVTLSGSNNCQMINLIGNATRSASSNVNYYIWRSKSNDNPWGIFQPIPNGTATCNVSSPVPVLKTYQVKVFHNNGCYSLWSNVAQFNIVYSTSACKEGLTEDYTNNTVRLSPNPSSGLIYAENIKGKTDVDVYDAFGKKQASFILSDSNFIFDLNFLKNGVYFLHFYSSLANENVEVKKIMLN